jgi:hypothetical protein
MPLFGRKEKPRRFVTRTPRSDQLISTEAGVLRYGELGFTNINGERKRVHIVDIYRKGDEPDIYLMVMVLGAGDGREYEIKSEEFEKDN